MNMLPLALIGEDAPFDISSELTALGFKVCVLPCDVRLQSPVRSHADMLICNIGNTVFCNAQYQSANKDIFKLISSYGYTVIGSDTDISPEYPNDILFNVATFGNSIIGNLRYTAPEIIDYAEKNSISCVSVKQGYTKCSTVLLGNKAAITADTGIASALIDLGINVLKVQNSPSAVSINGYDYGFIGGACGVLDHDVYFTGDIDLHPDGARILDFCQSNGFNVHALRKGQLTDVGGIIFLPTLF